MQEARDRADEPEPVQDDTGYRLGDLDEVLADHDYPTTADELVEAHGDREVETQDGSTPVDEVLAPVDDEETYDSPDDARDRIQGLLHR